MRKLITRTISMSACIAAVFVLGGADHAAWGFVLLFLFGPVLDFMGGLSLHLVVSGLFPRLHARHCETMRKSSLISAVVGFGVIIFLLIVIGVTAAGAGPLSVLILIIAVLLIAIGMQAPAANLGERIFRDRPESSDLARACSGWFAYSFVQYLPFIGTLFSLFAAIIGAGAFILALISGSKAPEASEIADEPETPETADEPEDAPDEPEKPKKTKEKAASKKKK